MYKQMHHWVVLLAALRDVATALGYKDSGDYNSACIDQPWEVVDRIAAL